MLELGMFSRYNLIIDNQQFFEENCKCSFVLIVSGASFMQVQNLLGQCSQQHLEDDEVDQGPHAVLGIAMVAMAEELGHEMAIRSLEHLQYGEQNIRRAVPLALALLCISNPKVKWIGITLLYHLANVII